jgi:hypothetical protein
VICPPYIQVSEKSEPTILTLPFGGCAAGNLSAPSGSGRSFRWMPQPSDPWSLEGIDAIVLSLSARSLTTGEIAAHFAEVYGVTVSRDTISRITDKVVEQVTEWQHRPLDRVYPVIFIASPDFGWFDQRVRTGGVKLRLSVGS